MYRTVGGTHRGGYDWKEPWRDRNLRRQEQAAQGAGRRARPADEWSRIKNGDAQEFEEESENRHQDEDQEPEGKVLVTDEMKEEMRKKGKLYEVVWKRGVAVRVAPLARANILGQLHFGETVRMGKWDPGERWRMIHYETAGGLGGLYCAWVMIEHHELGILMKYADTAGPDKKPSEKPQPQAQESVAPKDGKICENCGASCKKDAKFCSECGTPFPAEYVALSCGELKKEIRKQLEDYDGMSETKRREDERIISESQFPVVSAQEVQDYMELGSLQFEVMVKRGMTVRHLPSQRGKELCRAAINEHFDTFGTDESKQWRKVFCQTLANGKFIAGWVNVEDSSHPEQGPLLRQVKTMGLN